MPFFRGVSVYFETLAFLSSWVNQMLHGFRLGSLIERVRTGSVLAPLLALTLICAAVAIIVTSTLRLHDSRELMWFVWVLFGLCVIGDLIAFCLFAIFDADRLQTEHYRIARHRLDVIGDERDPNNEKLIESPPTANTFLETVQ